MKTQPNYRPNEQDYIAELECIQKSTRYILMMTCDPTLREFYRPAIKELHAKERLIKRALLKSTLPPLPDALRDPVNLIRPDLADFIRNSRRKYLENLDAEVETPIAELRQQFETALSEIKERPLNVEGVYGKM